MRRTALRCVHELARADERIVFVGSDLGPGTLDAMREEMPERFFMEGVAEANLIGLATGLALEGFVPYVNTIATFLTRRCLDQLAVDACLHRARVRLIANGGGMVYAPLGPTHQAIDDLALLRALPNLTILAPCDAEEMARLMPQTVEVPGPVYIRLAKGHDPIVSDPETSVEIGRAVTVRAGSDALAVTTGITLGAARAAADGLADEGVALGILHLPTIKPLDADAIRQAAAGARVVVTVEEHSIIGGLGSAVAEVLAERGSPARLVRLGLPDAFAERYGNQRDHLRLHGLTAEGVAAAVRRSLDRLPPTHS
ncbi:MAG: transketolase C-terminal domain-containing protein [Acidobacteriota bacterium]